MKEVMHLKYAIIAIVLVSSTIDEITRVPNSGK